MKSVTIGNQEWLQENLSLDKFRNGDSIYIAKSNQELIDAYKNSEPACCYYENDSTNELKYGKLYNWFAVNDPRGLAPEGWQIPTIKDWETLSSFLSGGTYKMIDKPICATTESLRCNDENNKYWSGNNKSGFKALPGGWFDIIELNFTNIGMSTAWWANKETFDENGEIINAWSICLGAEKEMNLIFNPLLNKGCCLSVRCIKDL